MYIAADCCSQTDTLSVMFSVQQPPSQHAGYLQRSLISNLSNTQPYFKIQQIRKNQLHRCQLISICRSFPLYNPLSYMYIATRNCLQQKKLLIFLSYRITGSNFPVNFRCPTGHCIMYTTRYNCIFI